MDIVKLVYEPFVMRAARNALTGRVRVRASPDKGRFTRSDVTRLLDGAWGRYDAAAGRLAAQPTLGSTMNVRLACFTLSFLEELLAAGAEREHGIDLIADATWQVYRLWARFASAAGHLSPGRQSALAFAVSHGDATVQLRFPFNAPGYVIEAVPAESGTAFNVVHCPVASYFRERGAADLCVASWCNLDFALSEVTHQKLVRSKTLVQGFTHCDFRISSLPSEMARKTPAAQGRAPDIR